MNFRQLTYFIAVAEELHFGRAAERLDMAQPPLSRQIKQLEEELGAVLFNRGRSAITLTQAGERLLKRGTSILAQMEDTRLEVRRLGQGAEGRLRIGFVGSATFGILPNIIRSFRANYPEVNLSLIPMNNAQLHRALVSRELDVAFARPALQDAEFVTRELLEEKLILALPDVVDTGGRTVAKLERLETHNLILYPEYPRPSYADFVLNACEAAGFKVPMRVGLSKIAPTDRHGDAGDVGRVVRRQEQDRACLFVERSVAFHERGSGRLIHDGAIPILALLLLRVRVTRHHARRRLRPAGCCRHNADATCRNLPGEACGDRVHAALGRRVWQAVEPARGDRRDVDDHAAFPRQHVVQRRTAAIERGEQRPSHLGVDLLRFVVLVGLGPDRAAHVVHQDVDPAPEFDGAPHRLFAALPGLEVHADRLGLAPRLADGGDNLVSCGRAVDDQNLALLRRPRVPRRAGRCPGPRRSRP
jgi:LysR family transcriptional regulator, benzoate and cis,cis-muconate-responsive activator of ben and cat genes